MSWQQTAPSWVERERLWGLLRDQVDRLGRRALSRPVLVIGLTLLASASIVGRQSLKPERYSSSVTFVVTESTAQSNLAEQAEYQTKSGLRDYVASGIFTKKRRLELIEQFDIYPQLKGLAASLILMEFESDLEIEVYKNYFLEGGFDEPDQVRSARMRIRFSHGDRAKTLTVARGLAGVVREHESKVRRNLSKAAARRARQVAEVLSLRIERLQAEQTRKMLMLQQASGMGPAEVRIDLADREIKRLQRLRRRGLSTPKTEEALWRARERRRMLGRLSGRRLAAGGAAPTEVPSSAFAAQLRVELGELAVAIEKQQQALTEAQSARAERELTMALEREEMLLRFRQVDWGHTPDTRWPRPLRLSVLGIGVFVLLLPLVGIGVAAFDTRVHDLDDVRQLNLVPLGHVPGFAGDEVGCLNQRVAAAAVAHGKGSEPAVASRVAGPDEAGC